MALLTYEQVRPWAKGIKDAVVNGRMPPWFADPHVGKFTNDRSMPETDRKTMLTWIDSGAKPGKPSEAPAAIAFTDGWAIDTPEAVYEMPSAFEVPKEGTIDYTFYIVPSGFTEDKWVTMAEARPGNRAVVHHIIVFAREPNSKWLRDYPVGEAFVPRGNRGGGEFGGEFVTGYAPGLPPESLRPGQAKLIKAGSDLVFQMHYTASGKVETDRSKVGLVFAKEPPAQRVLTLAAANSKFVIPPGANNHQVDGSITLHAETELVGLLPHMHLRGKAMEMRAVYPTGETEKLLWVPRYDFNWQLWYQLPAGKVLPKGTRIEATGYFDNSPNNKDNPNPNVEVRHGDQSWEEMMIGFFNVAIDAKVNPRDILRAPKKKAEPANKTGGGE